MDKALCIHGHFYQPPREDPWLGEILPEGSAAPARHWNERIARESYAPLAYARRLDDQGKIIELMNCYEWISFNFGPTLLNWLETAEPAAYDRLIQADHASLKRWGHGNALAQIYHHVILPLASPLHKELEINWAMMDFEARFGRQAEGIWLSEAAADIETLEALADAGIRFTLLAPQQAEALYTDGKWQPIDSSTLDISQPYLADLPSGRELAVFFYNGPLSQAVAFEGLLRNGEAFWKRLAEAATAIPSDGLLTLGTDGETYGHHFKFGEMALAYVLDQARSERDNCGLINLGAYLERHPPRRRIRIKSPSSWSCFHGVERWRSDCGCTTGGHPGWNQKWRGPLRQAIAHLNARIDEHFFSAGQSLFTDPKTALLNYGRVLAGSMKAEEFTASQMIPALDTSEQTRAWKLLAMVEWSLASQASCAWFFDEISRIEPLNAMTFALRAADLARDTGGPDLEQNLEQDLAAARSNMPELGDGRELFRSQVVPRRESLTSLSAQALFRLWAEDRMPEPGDEVEVRWDKVRMRITMNSTWSAGTLSGSCRMMGPYDSGDSVHSWTWQREDNSWALSGHVLAPSQFDVVAGDSEAGWLKFEDIALNKRLGISLRYAETEAEKQWASNLERAIQSGGLFVPRQEAQFTLNLEPEWTKLWAGLSWGYVLGMDIDDQARELLLEFLQHTGNGHPEAHLLAQRICREIEHCIENEPTRLLQTLGMIQRSRELGLPEDLWGAQNSLWRHHIKDNNQLGNEVRELAAALGFAVE